MLAGETPAHAVAIIAGRVSSGDAGSTRTSSRSWWSMPTATQTKSRAHAKRLWTFAAGDVERMAALQLA